MYRNRAVRWCIVAFMLMPVVLRAQEEETFPRRRSRIIDDTTRQVYGPQTSRWFTFEDWFYERWVTNPVDTVIRDFHFIGVVEKNRYHLQDLGNIGTALRPLFPGVNANIGLMPGFSVYDAYWEVTTPTYFNTRSPYSNLHVILGGRGRSLTEVSYSRNVNPRLNFGFQYSGLFIDKQIQRRGKGDRHVKNNSYNIFLSYFSKDTTYALLADFRRMYHRVFEYGGVQLADGYVVSDLFRQSARPWLENAEANDLRRNYHIYQQYRPFKALQFYHRMESYRQRNQYIDDPSNPYYDTVVISPATGYDQLRFKSLRNEVGLKGRAGEFFFNGFLANRYFAVDNIHLEEGVSGIPAPKGFEWYTGGELTLPLIRLGTLSGRVAWMFDDRYYLSGKLITPWLEASLSRSVSTPPFLVQAYRSNHHLWQNNFSNTESSELGGNLIIRTKRVALYPGITMHSYRNLIFFRDGFSGGQPVLPVQTGGYQTTLLPRFRFSVEPVKNLFLRGEWIYATVLENSGNALQLPRWFGNTQLSYANIWFNGNFDFQVGVDVHYKSPYYAYGYSPSMQQFYLQTGILAPDFPIADVFLNAKILRGRIFLRYHNVLKSFLKTGPVPTPYYPGVRNTIDFGFDWSFYD
jgi:hypothetical protein